LPDVYFCRTVQGMEPKQPSRQVKWAIKERLRMMFILGGKCVFCPATECLTFDCIKPTGDRHHRMSSVQRMSYYREQMRRGNLQILCHTCNTRKGAKEQPAIIPVPVPVAEYPPKLLPPRTQTQSPYTRTYKVQQEAD
jgi:hypothetical protein